jgi:hypothetical protein
MGSSTKLLGNRLTQAALSAAVSALGLGGAYGQVTSSWLLPTTGGWTDATKWSTNPLYPNGNYNAVIAATGGSYSISFNADVALANLTINSSGATVVQTGGTLNIAGALNVLAGTYIFNGGAISAATINGASSASFVTESGMFDNVTLGIPVSVGHLIIRNDLTLTSGGQITSITGLPGSSTGPDLVFSGSTTGDPREQRLRGNGMIVLDGDYVGLNSFNVGSPLVLTVEPGVTITNAGQTGYPYAGIESGYVQNGRLINQGLFWARTPGRMLELKTQWTNQGVLRVSDGTLGLGGSFGPSDIGTIERLGGGVWVTGEMLNANNTLELNNQTGSWTVTLGGRIAGGTLNTVGGAALVIQNHDIYSSADGTLDGVRIGGTLRVESGLAALENGTTFLPGSQVFLGAAMYVGQGQNLTGTTTITFTGIAGSVRPDPFWAFDSSIEAGIVIRTGDASGVVGGDSPYSTNPLYTFTNHGLISASTPGKGISVGFSNGPGFVNAGIIQALNDTTITMAGNWSNVGTIELNDGTLTLGGTFSTSKIGTISRVGGTVNITGEMNNSGTSLSLNPQSGSYNLRSGSITGGSITTAGGANLNVYNSARLIDVTIAGEVRGVAAPGDLIRVDSGLHFAGGSLTLAGGSGLAAGLALFTGALDGAGTILFGGDTSNNLIEPTFSTPLVIAPGVTIRSDTQGGRVGRDGGPHALENHGTIWAATAGREVALAGNWTNTGTLLVSDGTLALGGSFTTAGIGTLIRSGGQVAITGSLNNSNAHVALSDATGSWWVKGTVAGGSISASGQAKVIGAGGTLNGVALLSDLLIDPGNTSLLNGSTFSGRTATLVSGQLSSNGSTLGNAVQVILDGAGNNVLNVTASTFVLDAASTIRTGTGGGTLAGPSSGLATNLGAIWLETPGRSLWVSRFNNQGTLHALNGTTLSLSGGSNSGLVNVSASTLTTTSTWANSGTVTVANSNVLMGGTWSNSGTMIVQDSTLVLGGSFTLADALNIQPVGNVPTILTGSCRLNGVFAPSPATGSWLLLGGRLSDGTIAAATGGAALILPQNGSVNFSQITLDTDFEIPQGASINSAGTLTLRNHELSLRENARLYYNLTFWAVIGNGTVVFNGEGASVGSTSVGSLTLGPTTIRTGTTGGSIGAPSLNINSMATISAQTAGTNISIVGKFTNTGVVEARNGASINFASPATVVNFNNGTLSSGGWFAFSNSSIHLGGASILVNNAIVTLDGPGSSFPAIEGFQAQQGFSFRILGGRDFQTVPGFVNNSGTLLAGVDSTLTLGPESTNNGTLQADGGTIDALDLTNYSAGVLTGGTYRALASGVINLPGPVLTNAGSIRLEAASALIPHANSLTLNNGTLLISGGHVFTSTGSVTNQGSITVQSGSTIAFSGLLNSSQLVQATSGSNVIHCTDGLANNIGTTANAGRVSVGSLSVLRVDGTFTNAGTVILNGSAIFDYDSISPMSLLLAQIQSGYNNGSWNGIGINRTVSAANVSKRIGYAEASALAVTDFAGLPVDSTSALLRLTFGGDTDLDGDVDVADLGRLASSWQTAADWFGGDFDYNGSVDVGDLGILASNWQAGVISAAVSKPTDGNPWAFDEALSSFGLPSASVPEPSQLGWVVAVALRCHRGCRARSRQ